MLAFRDCHHTSAGLDGLVNPLLDGRRFSGLKVADQDHGQQG